MPQVTFYRQKRFDEGVRTGIDVDGAECWHHFAPGPEDGDSGLLWFVDLSFEGELLPDGAEEVHEWLDRQGPAITAALRSFAHRYEIGLDAGPYPQRHPIESLPDHVTGEIAVSAVNRMEARHLNAVLIQLADEWSSVLARLDRMSGVT